MEKTIPTAREIVAASYVFCDGDWDAIEGFIRGQKEKDPDAVKEAAARLAGDYVAITDSAYRAAWKGLRRPPFIVRYEGDYGASARKGLIYVIGADGRPSDEILSRFGIERSKAIWEDEGHRIHIGDDLTMWCGKPEKDNCRLAAGIAEAVAVVSEIKPEDSVLGLSYAVGANKDVYICPTDRRSLNNAFIKDGAYLLDGPDDISDELAIRRGCGKGGEADADRAELREARLALQKASRRGHTKSARDLLKHYLKLLAAYKSGLIGKRVHITKMDGEPQYEGRVGTVESIDAAYNLHGTWGGLALIPGVDDFSVIGEDDI